MTRNKHKLRDKFGELLQTLDTRQLFDKITEQEWQIENVNCSLNDSRFMITCIVNVSVNTFTGDICSTLEVFSPWLFATAA